MDGRRGEASLQYRIERIKGCLLIRCPDTSPWFLASLLLGVRSSFTSLSSSSDVSHSTLHLIPTSLSSVPNYTGSRDYVKEKAARYGRRENIIAEIEANEANIANYIRLPLEYSCKTCVYYDGRCFLPRSADFPNGNARGPCAYYVGQNCSFIKAHKSSRSPLQAWLNDAAAHPVKHDHPDPTSGGTKPIVDLKAKPATAIAQSSKDAAATDTVSTSNSTTSLPVPSARLGRLSATPLPSLSSLSNPSDQFAQQVNGQSSAYGSKRSRSESDLGLDTSNMTPAKAARLATIILPHAKSVEEAVDETLKDTHFRDLILGLVKQHKMVLKSRDDATTIREKQEARLKTDEAAIKVLQDQKAELEADKGTLVMERDAAAVVARDQTTVANEKHKLQIYKATTLIKSLEDQKAEWEKERSGLLMNVAAMLTREKDLDFENRYTELEVKNKDTEALLRTTQNLLKEAELAKETSEAEMQREKEIRNGAEEDKRANEARMEAEKRVIEAKLEEKCSMITDLSSRLHEKAREMVSIKDNIEKEKEAAQIKIKEMQDEMVGMVTEKKRMGIAMRGMEVRLEEMENLRNRNTSAVQRANACRDERNQAQASLAIAQGERIRASTKLEHTQTALDAAGATIQKLQNDKTQLLQKESANRVTVTPKLANLQASHHQLETDKKQLKTEVQQAKQRIGELEVNLQISEASLVDHIKAEKELVASKILAINYKEQRDEARNHLLASDKAKTDMRMDWNMKSAEMSRLHAEIRKLKGEKPRIGEGVRADSGSIGEVEGLIDMSMED